MESPLGSVDFLNDLQSILQSRFTQTTVDQCLDPAGRSGAELHTTFCPGPCPCSRVCRFVLVNSGCGGLPVAGVLPSGEEPEEAGTAEG